VFLGLIYNRFLRLDVFFFFFFFAGGGRSLVVGGGRRRTTAAFGHGTGSYRGSRSCVLLTYQFFTIF
jgi:hypothetical protein